MKHKWTHQVQGVTGGSGRPHGVDGYSTCSVCGAGKSRGPWSTHSGKRLIRWHYNDAHGYGVDSMPRCLGHNPQSE